MNERYKRTQIGYPGLIILIGCIVLASYYLINYGFHRAWITLSVLIIVMVTLGLFSTLTVEINDENIRIKFGPGLIRKRFPLKDIESSQKVKNCWYWGWGIRLIPGGWLYNVSGLSAVELRMKNGKTYRIGTDDPNGLAQAIQRMLIK